MRCYLCALNTFIKYQFHAPSGLRLTDRQCQRRTVLHRMLQYVGSRRLIGDGVLRCVRTPSSICMRCMRDASCNSRGRPRPSTHRTYVLPLTWSWTWCNIHCTSAHRAHRSTHATRTHAHTPTHTQVTTERRWVLRFPASVGCALDVKSNCCHR